MTLETKLDLSEETIEHLQDLIQANIDSYDGYRESAEKLENPSMAQLFRDLASERSGFASELQSYVALNDDVPETSGSVTAAVHRVWINVRNLFNDGDDYEVLAEAERGEDHIKEAYEKALKETAGSAMNDVLMQQYTRVKSAHDRIRDMRDARQDT